MATNKKTTKARSGAKAALRSNQTSRSSARKSSRSPGATSRAAKPGNAGGKTVRKALKPGKAGKGTRSGTPGARQSAARSRTRTDANGRQPGAASVATGRVRSATDQQLLTLLQADGRASNLALAKAVGLSPAACHDRVRKLIAQGLVSGFAGHLDASAMGVELLVFATVQLDRSETRVIETLRKAIASNTAFMECHLVAGGADILLKIRTQNLASYQRLLDEVLFPIRGVRSVNSHTCTRTLKETCAIPL